MGTIRKDLREGLEQTLDELERVGDQIRLKLHLANMDAKDAWKELEPQVQQAREHAKSAGEESRKGLEDLLAAVRRFAATL